MLAVAASAPAAAATILNFGYLGSSNAILTSVAKVDQGVTLTAEARRFSITPSLLTNISDLTVGSLRTGPQGLGVNSGSLNATLDTNTTSREAILLTGSRTLRLSGAVLNALTNADTLQVFGVNPTNGKLISLGYGGTIRTGLGGAATFVNSPANGNTTTLNFVSPPPAFTQFVLTTRLDGATGATRQDYRIAALSFAIPEPQTWALMIIGFGLVGVAARRRKAVVAA